MTVIYALKDPVTEAIRYVGKTSQNPRTRLRAHINRARDNRGARHCASWISSLIDAGLEPLMQVLETVSADSWEEAEKRWIRNLRDAGANLVNMTEGGGCHAGHATTEEVREKISEAARKQFASEEARKAAAEYGRRTWQDPEVAARLKEARRKTAADPEFIRKQREAKIRLNLDPAYRARVAASHKGRHSGGAKSMWERPEYRAARALARELRYGNKAHG